MKNSALLFLTLPILCACTTNMGLDYEHYLTRKGVKLPTETSEEFTHCHGYGCKFKTPTSLNKAEWKQINALFTPPAKTAEAEQTQIKKAIASMEKTIGKKTGTESDIYGTFIKLGNKQLDCVDESTNTTTYLAMLQNHGLLKHHTLSSPAVRLPIIHAGRWPHQTATMIENKTQTPYVVDSWFHDNGFAPEIVTLKEWKQGWKPETHHQQQKPESK